MSYEQSRHSGWGGWARRIGPLLVVIVMLAIGCSGSDSSKPSPSPEPSAGDEPALKKRLDRIAAEVADLRGLSPKTEVHYAFISSDELRSRIVEMAEEELPVEETQTYQEILAFLGLLEEGQNLRTILLDLYTEQIVGFYDTEAEQLFVVGDASEMGPIEEITFVHEYTHALQDQHFDLDAFLPQGGPNSDADLARVSLAEGDATAVEIAYVLKSFDAAEALKFLAEAESLQTEAFDAAPRFLQQTLLFPYEAGFEFVNTFESHGDLDRAYADPPQSTEHILHPEAYRLRDEPRVLDLSAISRALEPEWVECDRDVWGELNARIYLETFIGEGAASDAAAGWDGDQYLYLKDAAGRKLWILHSVWDRAEDAGEFWDACVLLGARDDRAWETQGGGEGTRWWANAHRYFFAERSSESTLLIISEDGDAVPRILSVLPEFDGS